MTPRLFFTLYQTSILFFSTIITIGCSVVGPTTASNGGIAIGGTSNVKVETAASLSLGDQVAKTALKAAKNHLPTHLADEKQKAEAVRKGIEVGLKKAREEGQMVTPEAEKELEAYLTAAIDK